MISFIFFPRQQYFNETVGLTIFVFNESKYKCICCIEWILIFSNFLKLKPLNYIPILLTSVPYKIMESMESWPYIIRSFLLFEGFSTYIRNWLISAKNQLSEWFMFIVRQNYFFVFWKTNILITRECLQRHNLYTNRTVNPCKSLIMWQLSQNH